MLSGDKMLWLPFALLSNFFYAITSIVDQLLRKRHVKDNVSLTIMWIASLFLIWLIIMPFIGISIPPLPKIIAALAAGFITVVIALPYFYALSAEEASRVIPIWQFSSIFVLIMSALFLGESLLTKHYYGFAAMLTGGILLGIDRKSAGFRLNKAVLAVLVASVAWAVHIVLVKYFYATEPFWNGFFWISIGSFTGAAFLAAISGNAKRLRAEFRAITKKGVSLLLASTLVTLVADLALLLALKNGPAALVSVVGATQMMFLFVMTVAISLYFPRILRENISRKALLIKLAAISLMISGLYLIR